MEFRKMVMITLYAKQKKRQMYRTDFWTLWEKARVGCFERTTLKLYIIYNETDHQPRLDAWDKSSGLVHWEDPEGSGGRGGGRGGSGWGTHVNPWLIHVNVWQNPLQYCKAISLQLIKKLKKIYELFISGISHLIFFRQLTTGNWNLGSEATDKGGLLYSLVIMLYIRSLELFILHDASWYLLTDIFHYSHFLAPPTFILLSVFIYSIFKNLH